MKIIILGAGQVGTVLAQILASEGNDITVIDIDGEKLRSLQEYADVRTIQGSASYPIVLQNAGADDSDMIIAVTNSDETNMIACQVAYSLFRTPTKIARVRAAEYIAHETLFTNEALPIDKVISPEQLVTQYIKRLILHPDTLQVLNFADGRVQLVGMRAYYGGDMVGQALSDLKKHLPDVDVWFAAIYRRGKAISPNKNTVIEPDDEVFFLAAPHHITQVMRELRHLEPAYKRIIIAGGGNIGFRLAEVLENQFHVKVIDHNKKRIELLSNRLDKTIVLQGDCADKELLLDENINQTDVFCAVTNRDEANIMSAILAKRLGARKVMALINRSAYVDIAENLDIDIVISPQQTTIGSLLTHIRKGDVVNVHSLRRGAAEAIEAIAHGDAQSSKVVGRRIKEVKLPPSAVIGAIVRKEAVIIAHDEVIIEPEDHVILFLMDKTYIKEVDKLFQVGIGFI
ncbi:MAG: Trk system potassium transporter TrkA [Gammaproteobacteria bacterium]